MGDKVTIRRIPKINTNVYVAGQKLTRQKPSRTPIHMYIDKGRYWSFEVNDVERFQADLDYVRAQTQDAAEEMAIDIDTEFLEAIPSDVHASNAGTSAGARSGQINLGTTGSPVTITPGNALMTLTKCKLVLDEQNAPKEGRWAVIPNWMTMLLLNSDIRDMNIGGGGPRPMRNGRVGQIAGFTLYESNNLNQTTDGSDTVEDILFGQKQAVSFATQIVEKRMIPNPDDFGEICEGLQVYGYKTVQPTLVGHLYATWSAS
jgi:hypothetical protein